jgi:hypothetical protein
MTKKSFNTVLRAYQIRKPFRPFTVELVSGSSIAVRHPEGLVTQGGVAVYIDPDGELTIFEAEGVAQFHDGLARRASA